MHAVLGTGRKHWVSPQAALDAEKAAEMAPQWPKPHYRWAQVCSPDERAAMCSAKGYVDAFRTGLLLPARGWPGRSSGAWPTA